MIIRVCAIVLVVGLFVLGCAQAPKNAREALENGTPPAQVEQEDDGS